MDHSSSSSAAVAAAVAAVAAVAAALVPSRGFDPSQQRELREFSFPPFSPRRSSTVYYLVHLGILVLLVILVRFADRDLGRGRFLTLKDSSTTTSTTTTTTTNISRYSTMSTNSQPQQGNLDRYVVIHVATTCDEHGVYVTKDSAEVIELGWILLDAKSCDEVGTVCQLGMPSTRF